MRVVTGETKEPDPTLKPEHLSADIALLADMVGMLAGEIKRMQDEALRKRWWQFWRPKEQWTRLQENHLQVYGLTIDMRNARDPEHKLERVWTRGQRWYL